MALTETELPVIGVIGCGWLGLPLAASLVEDGYIVRGTTTSGDKLDVLRSRGIDPYKVTLQGTQVDLPLGLTDVRIWVINIPPGRRRDGVALHYPAEILGFMTSLDKAHTDHLIYVSSTGVYDDLGQTVDESGATVDLRDGGSGAAAVLKAEDIVRSMGIPYTILRMSGLVGGERQPGKWFAGRSGVPGGDTPVNMVHRSDCIRAIHRVIEEPSKNAVFNICADQHPKKAHFYDAQTRKIGLEPPVFLPGTVPYKIVSNDRFKSTYDFVYRYPDPASF